MAEERELTQEEQTKNLYAELAQREMARRYYRDYLAYAHGAMWKKTRMSTYIADAAQRFLEEDTGHAYDILVIETPPQHGKSMTLTETLPSWYLGKHPNDRVIIASYDSDFAEKFCRRNKEKVKTIGVNVFGIGIGSVDRAGEFELNNGKGRLISRGIMSGITGNPANLVIIDDPVKNMQEADSPTYRSRLWEEWQASIKSRLQANGKVIVIMTPWHEDDFAARILNSEPNSSLIRLPVEAEEDDPLGREVGEPLCPELGKDSAWLTDFRESYIHDPQGGQRSWTALYQCSPRAETGNVVHRDWWRFYDPEDEESRNRQYGKMIVSVDAAFKDTDSADYVSIQVWGKNRNDYFLLYCINKHLDFPATVQALRAVKSLYPQAHAVYIEDKANGSAIISTLQHEMYCIPVNPRGGKKARVNAISFAIESGHVYLPLPEKVEWVSGFIDQFTAFPNGAHDDMCFVAGTKIATLFGDKPIEEVKEGDYVITPCGIDRVEWSGQTGVSATVSNKGLEGTAQHKVYTDDGFVNLESLTADSAVSGFNFKELFIWFVLTRAAGQGKFNSMGSPTDLWVRSVITSVNLQQMRGGGMRRVFTELYGRLLAERRFLPATRSIIRMGTALITASIIWSAYHFGNTARCLRQQIKSCLTLMTSGRSLKSGTAPRKDASGTADTAKRSSETYRSRSTTASSAAKSSSPERTRQDSAATTAMLNGGTETKDTMRLGYANIAVRSLNATYLRPAQVTVTVPEPAPVHAEQSSGQKPVYNLRVRRSHLYYANGLLVHNCDACSQALNQLLYDTGALPSNEPVPERELKIQRAEREFNDPAKLFNPYGGGLFG